jgi:hypothetical protein
MKNILLQFLLAGWAGLCLMAQPQAILTGEVKPDPIAGGDTPITATRLTGARLEYHRADPSLVWTFTAKTFVLELGGQTRAPDLIETLMGTSASVLRIRGNWKLEEQKGRLLLSNIQGDGKKGRRRTSLAIEPAGHIRVNLGTYQYNLIIATGPPSEPTR